MSNWQYGISDGISLGSNNQRGCWQFAVVGL